MLPFIIFFISAQSGRRNCLHSVIMAKASAPRAASYLLGQYSMISPIRRFASSMATGSKAFTLAPASTSLFITVSEGASRMSSVSGLNARPHRAMTFPEILPPKASESFTATISFWLLFTLSTASITLILYPASSPMCERAFTSLGKHEPP